MTDLVARTGRHQQRYEGGCRLVAGCIPYKYGDADESSDAKCERVVQVLMINSPSGPGLLFPKGGWENDEEMDEAARREALEEAGVRGDIMKLVGYYNFKSKTHQDKLNPEGLCKAVMFALLVKEELQSWPEQSIRERKWLSIPDAVKQCRHAWMEEALHEFQIWHEDNQL
ncbi:unnamed protein product [Victoria cruziana]